MKAGNEKLFIDAYLKKISKKFNIDIDSAFEVLSISAIIDRPFEEVYREVVVGGGGDGGIDGVHFTEEYDEKIIYSFQCKNTKSLKQNSIEKFLSDYRTLFIEGNKVGKKNTGSIKNILKLSKIL